MSVFWVLSDLILKCFSRAQTTFSRKNPELFFHFLNIIKVLWGSLIIFLNEEWRGRFMSTSRRATIPLTMSVGVSKQDHVWANQPIMRRLEEKAVKTTFEIPKSEGGQLNKQTKRDHCNWCWQVQDMLGINQGSNMSQDHKYTFFYKNQIFSVEARCS